MPLCILNSTYHNIVNNNNASIRYNYPVQNSQVQINGTLVIQSLNVSNLASTNSVNMDPSGNNLFCVAPGAGTVGYIVYNVKFSDNSYTTTAYNTSSTGGGYGSISNLVVGKKRIYALGGFTSINGDSTILPPAVATIGGTGTSGTLTSYYKTTYSTRYIYSGAFDNTNTVYITATNYFSGPTDSYYYGNNRGVIIFEDDNSGNLVNLSNFYNIGDALDPSTGLTATANTGGSNLCFDLSYSNIYITLQCNNNDGFPVSRNGQYNAVVKYDIIAKTLTLFATLSKIDSRYPNFVNQNIIASYNYVYVAITNSYPVVATDGTSLACNYIMAVNMITRQISAMGAGLNGVPYAMAYDASRNYVYVGGAFTLANGFSVGYTAYWDEKNLSWNKLVTLNGLCSKLVYSPTYSQLFFSGNFTSINGTSCNGFASFTVT